MAGSQFSFSASTGLSIWLDSEPNPASTNQPAKTPDADCPSRGDWHRDDEGI